MKRLNNLLTRLLQRAKERAHTIASCVLLCSSLAVLLGISLVQGLRKGIESVYYNHLYKRLAWIRVVLDSVRRSRVQSMAIIVTLVLIIPMLACMRVGVAVTVDGRVLGYVEDQSQVQRAVQTIEAQSSKVLGEPFALDATVSYEVGMTTQGSFLSVNELPGMIADNVDSLASIAVVEVDGKAVGACAEETQVTQMLDEIKAEAAAGDATAQVSFVQDVQVKTMQAPTELLMSQEDLKEILLTASVQEQTYEVSDTDTMTSIAKEQGMTLEDLLALNPDVVPERMAPGSEVIVHAAMPMVSVQVVTTKQYTQAIAYKTETRENASLGKGKTNVIQQGVAGVAEITAEIITVDGVEQERTVLTRTVKTEAVSKIVEVGTKNLGVGTGTLIAPVNAAITSGYKYRWGRMHKGVDFGVSVGTSIHAADNGRVIVSEYSSSGYGYYVIIDHGNGMKTLYAHNSKLLVNVGDTVEQGQVIARSGNTGNSTGPHCHFEVLIDDENVNPANYI